MRTMGSHVDLRFARCGRGFYHVFDVYGFA